MNLFGLCPPLRYAPPSYRANFVKIVARASDGAKNLHPLSSAALTERNPKKHSEKVLISFSSVLSSKIGSVVDVQKNLNEQSSNTVVRCLSQNKILEHLLYLEQLLIRNTFVFLKQFLFILEII